MKSGQTMLTLLIGAAVVAPVAAHAESAMPQLDSTFFPSQIFWLVVTGVLLYLLMRFLALPRVSSMVQLRDDMVHADLQAAYKLKQQAEDIKIAYTRTLRDADEKAHGMIEQLTRDLKEKQYAALAKTNAAVQLKIIETENYLRGERDALVQEAPLISQRLADAVIQQLSQPGR